MWMQRNVEEEIAIRTAIDALAALPCQAQALAVGRPLRNSRLELTLDPPHAALFVVFRNRQAQIDNGAAVGILERDVGGDFVILSGNRHVGALAAAAAAAGESGKKVGEVDVVEGRPTTVELVLPARWR